MSHEIDGSMLAVPVSVSMRLPIVTLLMEEVKRHIFLAGSLLK